MNLIPGLKLRVDEKTELEGLDYDEIGEFAFEALTEKAAKWSVDDFVGGAEATEHGGVVSK